MTAVEYRHLPTGTLAVLAQRLGKVWASPSTSYALVRKYGWRRPRLRVHPAKPKVGIRTTQSTRRGLSTPPSSACLTAPAPTCTR
jgi:putative transposase